MSAEGVVIRLVEFDLERVEVRWYVRRNDTDDGGRRNKKKWSTQVSNKGLLCPAIIPCFRIGSEKCKAVLNWRGKARWSLIQRGFCRIRSLPRKSGKNPKIQHIVRVHSASITLKQHGSISSDVIYYLLYLLWTVFEALQGSVLD